MAAPPPDARALSGRQALQCIKRKKMYEGQVEKIGQARLNLETQQLALEQLNLNKEVVEAQREGAKTMASVTAQMGEWLSACALRAVCPVPRVRDTSPRHVRDTYATCPRDASLTKPRRVPQAEWMRSTTRWAPREQRGAECRLRGGCADGEAGSLARRD